MKRFWADTLVGKIFSLIAGAAILGFVGYILIDTARIVITHDRQDAVVTECRGSWGPSANVGRPHKSYGYAPVALSPSGEKARGSKRLSRKGVCERLIGTNTWIYVNPNPKGKNSYGGFLDFWLSAFLIVVLGATVIRSRIQKLALPCGIAFGAAAMAYEFSAYGINQAKTPELLTTQGKFDACIQDHMNKEGISNPRDLRELICYQPTNMDLLWGMYSLESLRIENADMTTINSIASLPNLKSLTIARSPNLTNFSGLTKYAILEELHLHQTGLKSIQEIPDLPNLRSFELWSSKFVTDLNGIERFKNLEKIELERNAIVDISAIAPLTKLSVFFSAYEPFTDISALANKPLLQTARFSGSKVMDFSPLYGLPSLRHSGATGDNVPCDQMEKLRTSVDRKLTLWLPKHCK